MGWWDGNFYGLDWYDGDWFLGESDPNALSAELSGAGAVSGTLTATGNLSALLSGAGSVSATLSSIDHGTGGGSGVRRRQKRREPADEVYEMAAAYHEEMEEYEASAAFAMFVLTRRR